MLALSNWRPKEGKECGSEPTMHVAPSLLSEKALYEMLLHTLPLIYERSSLACRITGAQYSLLNKYITCYISGHLLQCVRTFIDSQFSSLMSPTHPNWIIALLYYSYILLFEISSSQAALLYHLCLMKCYCFFKSLLRCPLLHCRLCSLMVLCTLNMSCLFTFNMTTQLLKPGTLSNPCPQIQCVRKCFHTNIQYVFKWRSTFTSVKWWRIR